MNNAGAYYISEGVSQQDRSADALNPDYFHIDERSVDDLLLFIVELSYQYNYYDNANTLAGDWSDFFMSDANLQLRIFPHFDFKRYFFEYDRRKQELAISASEDDLTSGIKDLIEWISKTFLGLQLRLYENFKTSITGRDEEKFIEFTNIVGSEAEYQKSILDFQPVYAKIRHASNIKYEELQAHLTVFDDLFFQFEIMHNRLVKAARYFLQKQTTGTVSYKPHISLVISFLELYQQLRIRLNQYTRKHLDFYYEKVLSFKPKKAVADKLSVVLRLNNGIDEFLVAEGEKMVATVPGQSNKKIFRLKEHINVNLAEIRELKTIYKHTYHNFVDMGEDFDPIKEYMIYAADNPVYSPGDFVKKKSPGKSWPLFGENQRYLPENEQSMEPVEIGMMISSALLFAVDGERNFSVRFHLNGPYFLAYFDKLAANYQRATGISKRVIIAELLNKAFLLDITGAEDWISIPRYSTLCSPEDSPDKFIDILFKLGSDDPAIGIYKNDVHVAGIDSNFPVLRVMLNARSFQTSYTFLFEQLIERITIGVTVKNSTRLKLQNNIGQLSPLNPFQLFGPMPSVGSYLDIRNTNIFNRFTTDFKIKLKWLDLPKNKDGFKAYYENYGDNITNESFKVGISEPIDDHYMETDEQQIFNLFEMNTHAGFKQYLSNTTCIDVKNFRKIHFENDPLLEAEEAAPLDFRGCIRMELVAPADAFYHKKYPVIFPGILMHNSKRYGKKLPVPGQPFTPMLRAVVIDYTLRHSETTGAKKDGNVETDILLWHVHPFGLQQIYLHKNKGPVSFFPSIAHENNLYIGLENVLPGKVLTMLFQLEESVTPELDQESKPVFWSYLDHNEWKNFDRSDILEDNTIDFKVTGIIKLIMPEDISKENSILNADLYWIRISTARFIGSRIKAVFTQVVTAIRQLDGDEPETNALVLAPNLVDAFSRKIPEIAGIYQPFPSYHGRAGETKGEFYTWVSEHLNHKQRLITAGDISRKILELFPDIHKVICYNSENNLPGNAGDDLQVVIIPKIKSIDEGAIIDPRVNVFTLYEISNYLRKNISPFINVNVRNPEYERIKVFCSVIFSDVFKDRSNGFLVQKLKNDLRRFISPWLFSEGLEVNENNGIYPSEILNFMKQLPYISFVTGFSVVQFYYHYNSSKGTRQARILDSTALNPGREKSPFIFTGKNASRTKLVFQASKPGAIIISSDDHTVNVLPKRTGRAVINKDDEVRSPKPGIGSLVVGEEFLVMNPYDVSEYPGIIVPAGKDDEDEMDFFYYTNS